jgi:hypothetical protein
MTARLTARLPALLATSLVFFPVSAAFMPPSTASDASVASIEAETLRLQAGNGEVRSDETASGGKAIIIWSNDTARGPLSMPMAASTLHIRARGEQCAGAPQMVVTIDGRQILAVNVLANIWTDYAAVAAVSMGIHQVGVTFTNDYLSGRCDRNLFVDRLTFTADTWQPPPPPQSTAGTVMFDSAIGTGNLSAYPTVIHPERISIEDDPILGSARKAMKFTVYDSDTGPTEDPRAQVETPASLTSGQEFWAGWSTLFPSDWPSLPCGVGAWLTVESVYGKPYSDASPVHLGMRGCSGALTWQRNSTYGWDIPWEVPITRGKWMDFTIHERLSQDASVGFVEIYLNTGSGWQQQKLNGQPRLYMKTLDSSNYIGPNDMHLELYRMKGMFDKLSVYHAAHKIGTSFSAVAPHSYG